MSAEPKHAIIEHAPQGQVVQADGASLMAVISRAASDPNTDVDKLERLMGLYERITARDAKAAYAAALAEMQPKLPVITERGKIVIKNEVQSRYALWEDINEAIRPLLAEHQFALSFRTGTAADGKITVTGILSHVAGHQEETTLALPHDSSGSKNAVQAVGSSTSYGKRYVASALLNLTSRGEDDDGKAAGSGPSITEEQVREINALVADIGAPLDKVLEFVGAEAVEKMTGPQYEKALHALGQRKRAKATKTEVSS